MSPGKQFKVVKIDLIVDLLVVGPAGRQPAYVYADPQCRETKTGSFCRAV